MTTIDTASSLLSEADHRAQLHRAVIASTVGTTIEWYDFFLYGEVTGLVFGKLFFPKSDPLAGGPAPLIATALLAAFGSGYVIAAYILFCAIVSVVATVLLPDTPTATFRRTTLNPHALNAHAYQRTDGSNQLI
jgi:hypothetical protein